MTRSTCTGPPRKTEAEMRRVSYFLSTAIHLLTTWMRFAMCSVRCPDWPTSTAPVWDVGLDGDNCYVMFKQTTGFWSIANEICELNDWRLFHVKTPEKNTFYTTLLESLANGLALPQCFWMGLTVKETEREWIWTDGSTPSYNLEEPELLRGVSFPNNCMRMCKGKFSNYYVWQASICEGGLPEKSGVICVTEGLSDEPKATTVPDVQRRPLRKEKRFVVHRIENLSGYRLMSAPVKVIRTMDITTCARACTSDTSVQCVVVNFQKRSRECALYSDFDVLTGEKERQSYWEVWRVL